MSLADQATIPLHAIYAKQEMDMNSSVTDLIGMIDSGAAQDVVMKEAPKN